MNKVILIGRLTRDPEVRYTENDKPMAIARYTLAVDRRFQRNNGGDQQTADFISCVAFGRAGEFAEKYFRKGLKIAVTGRIQTGSYTNKEGRKNYTTDVVIEEQEFAESKNSGDREARDAAAMEAAGYGKVDEDGFMTIPDGVEENLPFS